MKLTNGLLLCAALIMLYGESSYAQSSAPVIVYNIDWNERLAPDLGISAHTEELLGDQIDPHTGRLSFEHVDVSLPGNSDLPVEVRRRLNPSQPTGNNLADWQLEIPRISTNINRYEFSSGIRWGKQRCSKPLVDSIPLSNTVKRLDRFAPPIEPHRYSNGVNLYVPNVISTAILDKAVNETWPTNAVKVTAKNWYLTCISNIDGGGTEGFIAHAPNGNRYRFDVIQAKEVSQTDLWKVININQVSHSTEGTYMDMLLVSEVTDVHGNWVRYVYDNLSRLTKIHSNDGRVITLEYNGTGSNYIKTVIANPGTPAERRWDYLYASKNVLEWQPPSLAYDAPYKIWRNYYSLTSVILPDGRRWQFDLAGLRAKPIPGVSYEYRIMVDGSRKLSGKRADCKQEAQRVSLVHPDGIKGEFDVEERSRFLPFFANGPSGIPCPKTKAGGGYNTHQDLMAVVKKQVSAPGVPTAVWTYNYVNGYGEADHQADGINKTHIVRPDGSKWIDYFTTSVSGSGSPIAFPVTSHIKRELYETTISSSPIEKIEYLYLYEPPIGRTFVSGTIDSTRPIREAEVKISRGSDWYQTRKTFNSVRTSAAYSYGYPIKIERWSSLGGGTRTTDITYLRDADDWILGLTDTIIKNGKLFDDYDYDNKGRLITHKRFGVSIAKLTYHTSGTQAGKLSTYKDGLNRQTSYSNYYRGIPRTITRADNTRYTRLVNENGQVTRETNWRGHSTSYQYNEAGYLTLIDRPESWTDTYINYAYTGSGLIQTITKGGYRTTNTYDAMLRVVNVKHEDISASSPIYNDNQYDAMGRLIFASLPSFTPGSTIGKRTRYDSLGRVIQVAETASGGGITNFEYLTNNRVREKDPRGNDTITTLSGFGNPNDGQPLIIEKPNGIVTRFTYDIYGNVLTMAQARDNGTNLTSRYFYDNQYRLCRLRMPERGDTLYIYDAADQMIGYAEGQPAGTGCASLPTDQTVSLRYDSLGQLSITDYPGTTPDIHRTYDENGNLLAINRGGINWAYSYNSMDMIIEESLSIDGKSYTTHSHYDDNQILISKIYPSGRRYDYTNDWFGLPTHIQNRPTDLIDYVVYHPNGVIQQLGRQNGGSYEQRLNERQLISYIGDSWGDKRYYNYDSSGRITNIDSILYNVYDRSFGYDENGRLISATGPWGIGRYQYDTLGNITRKVEGPRIVEVQYDSLNRIASARDSAAGNFLRNYSHDARGNITNDGRHAFVYDYANQPVSISGATEGSYYYDGNMKRVKQVVEGETIYSFYDKAGTLLTRDNVTRNETTDYISIAGKTFVRVKNGVPTFPLNDHLGTALMEADFNGVVAADKVYNYTPWGEIYNVTPFGEANNRPGDRNEQGYTGHIEDRSGLVYMQARYYDPVVGRFLSTDPVGYADQLNLYAYVGNDPINFIDPTGNWGVWLGTYLATGDTHQANVNLQNSVSMHAKVSTQIVSTMTRLGVALDVVDIAQEIIAGASAVDEGAGVLAGEVVAEVTEKILDKNIGAEGAEVVGGIVGSVVGDLVEEKIETKLQENIDTEKPTDRR